LNVIETEQHIITAIFFFIKKSKYLKWQFKKIVPAIYKRKIMSESVTELQFSAVSKSPEMWKSVSSAIMTIVDEASFEAGPTGLTFRSMDPSHVALVDLSWPNSKATFCMKKD
jgi:Proliferating cell nuclear antigen, N-terminal domain